ncbi:MAG: tyrosine-type recombinase/integrase, partial [Usitatibacter sp.]
MARPSKEFDLTTKTARKRLDTKRKKGGKGLERRKPYYRTVGASKSLGYIRREDGPGSWIVREWENGRYKTRVIGLADDIGRADGRDVLTFEQALRLATSPALPPSSRARLTVGDALDVYLKVLESKSAHAKENKQRADKHIVPTLGGIRVDRLTKTQIEDWLGGLVKAEDPEDPDARRRSKDTANRTLTILKAALNAAFKDDANGIITDKPWRVVKPFRAVGRARADSFEVKQVRLLIAKAAEFDKPFAALLEAGYLTGARLGELASLDVRDFDAARGILAITRGKTGARVVSLSTEGTTFFRRLADKREPTDTLLPRVDGERW